MTPDAFRRARAARAEQHGDSDQLARGPKRRGKHERLSMTREQFRRMALGFPGSCEQSHMGHPDFRVRGKIFATLDYPEPGWAMVKLLPDQQSYFVEREPASFLPASGNWGRKGSTNVRLKAASAQKVQPALEAAWKNVAPKARVEKQPDPS